MATQAQYTAAANAVVTVLIAEIHKLVPPIIQQRITQEQINELAGLTATAAVDAAEKIQSS